ncbi:NAD(P)H-dependent oxidoreductase [Bacillus sp. BGMRC 2118]|nr:NAD(P)H-dependent oxidoreductase [Bacillus sp. BGMRC 2118]
MNIVIISGTPRKTGRTRMVATFLSKTYSMDLFDLSSEQVPLYNGEEEQDRIPSVQKLRNLVNEADGVIFVTPEYHNGMSGALKNALDFLSSAHFDQKPVALLAVCGGGKGGINALNNLRIVSRGLYANAIPRQLVLDPLALDYDLEAVKPEYIDAVEAVVDELKHYAKIHRLVKQEQLI